MTKATPKDAPSSTPEAERAQPFETYLSGLPAWQAAAVRASTNWPAGYAVTPAQFRDALKAATTEVIQ